jgi:hypothetical protein
MRPTTAFDGNVFDINALLHPELFSIIRRTSCLIPRSRFLRNGPFFRPGLQMHRPLPHARIAGACRPQGAGHYRRNSGSLAGTGRRASHPPGGKPYRLRPRQGLWRFREADIMNEITYGPPSLGGPPKGLVTSRLCPPSPLYSPQCYPCLDRQVSGHVLGKSIALLNFS